MMTLDSRSFRFTSSLVVLSMLVMSSPLPALAATNQAKPQAPKPAADKETFVSRPLNSAELAMRGKDAIPAQNPYTAGSQKFAPQHKGVDLLTGNFSMSATDLSFEGGFGVPVAITRTYSMNNADEGPYGPGWTLSADIRTTAGGLLQSPQSPIRSVPVGFKERPGTAGVSDGINEIQIDPAFGVGSPSVANQPVEAVIVTDASGRETTIQRDADGILTTPPWDNNQIDAEYTEVRQDGKTYRLQTAATIRTPEGTIYEYGNHGAYINGMGNPWVTIEDPVPSNILKIDAIIDRHGNETTFTYANSYRATYQKLNGSVEEDRLTSVTMPGGRTLVLVWTDQEDSYDRIVSVYRSGASGDTVDYEYDGSGRLTSVTSLGGKETTYSYAAADDNGESALPDTAPTVLRTITDPRGLTTTIRSCVADVICWPYEVPIFNTQTYLIAEPSGIHTYFKTTRSVGGPVTGTGQEWGDIDEGADNAGYFFEFDRAWDASDEPERQNHAHYQVELSGTNLFVRNITTSDGAGMNLSVYDAQKKYVLPSQFLVSESSRTYPLTYGDSLSTARKMKTDGYQYQEVTTDRTYNFMANPLSESVTESVNGTPTGSAKTVEYAYWGKSKYYQRKATRVQTGSSSYRYSFTDYFDDQATDGKKGQVYRVYDAKYGGISPGGTWRTTISASGDHAAEFDYNGNGQPTSVKKLQTTAPSYVETKTHYDPATELPDYVTEDYGSGKINRVTETDTYDVAGRATKVIDAAGRVFETVYNLDGQVETITQTDVNPDKLLVSYVYGDTSGVTNGMVTRVIDQLSGIRQDITYASSGSGIGQPSLLEEFRLTQIGSNGTAAYTYNSLGMRETATLTNPHGSVKWKYGDYIRVGNPESSSFVFRTLTKLDGSSNPTEEEMHYHFDSAGRLTNAAFGQDSAASSAPFYSTPAETRTRAYYYYDPAGRIVNLEHYYDDWDGTSAYVSDERLGQGYAYDAYKGLRTSATYYVNTSGSWSTEHVENYAYEAERDFLTGVHYTGGTPGTDWSYDPAGNRANSGYSYDNLNRMSASPGYAYDNHPGASSDADVKLGSRKWRNYGTSGAVRYMYDVLNRVSSVCSSTSGATYVYRADGMRVKKVEGLTISWVPGEGEEEGYYNENWTTDKPTTRYWYDGQMPSSEDFTRKIDGVTTVDQTQYGLGARGIDYIRVSRGSTVLSESYPIYDGHGNMIAQIDKSGTLANQRLYDVWGSVRSGSTTGEPSQRYCANLGHKQDDESGLIYMRARYYEPGTGRFISEDKAMDGINWYVYAESNPISSVDPSGNSNENIYMAGLGLILLFLAAGGVIAGTVKEILSTTSGKIMLTTGVLFLATWFADMIVPDSAKSSDELFYRWGQFANDQLAGVIITLGYAAGVAVFNRNGIVREMWGLLAAQALILAAFLAFDAWEQATQR